MIHSTGVPEWQILIWIVAIAAVDLMPVPTTMSSVRSVCRSRSSSRSHSCSRSPSPRSSRWSERATSASSVENCRSSRDCSSVHRSQAPSICESLVIKLVYPQWDTDRQPACANSRDRGCHTNIPRVALAVFCASIVRVYRQSAVRRLVQLLRAPREPDAVPPRGARGRVRRVPDRLHGSRALQRPRDHRLSEVPVFSVVDLPGAVAVRQTDVPANALAAAGHR